MDGADVSGERSASPGTAAAGASAPDVGASAGETALFEAAASLGETLRSLATMVATVESCTGGLIAAALTGVPGSSAWFERGWVTYSNRSKVELVGVSRATLAAHGAVSEPVAREMAAGGLARSRAGLAIAVTGIAGPGGAVPGKPVGTVCFAWAPAGRPVITRTVHFDGPRAAVRLQAARYALGVARALLSADPED